VPVPALSTRNILIHSYHWLDQTTSKEVHTWYNSLVQHTLHTLPSSSLVLSCNPIYFDEIIRLQEWMLKSHSLSERIEEGIPKDPILIKEDLNYSANDDEINKSIGESKWKSLATNRGKILLSAQVKTINNEIFY
jgi:hypothetical protein